MSFIIGEGGKRINEGRANKCEEIREAVWKDVKCIRYIFPFFFFRILFQTICPVLGSNRRGMCCISRHCNDATPSGVVWFFALLHSSKNQCVSELRRKKKAFFFFFFLFLLSRQRNKIAVNFLYGILSTDICYVLTSRKRTVTFVF